MQKRESGLGEFFFVFWASVTTFFDVIKDHDIVGAGVSNDKSHVGVEVELYYFVFIFGFEGFDCFQFFLAVLLLREFGSEDFFIFGEYKRFVLRKCQKIQEKSVKYLLHIL